MNNYLMELMRDLQKWADELNGLIVRFNDNGDYNTAQFLSKMRTKMKEYVEHDDGRKESGT